MKFELMAGTLVNLDLIESISAFFDESKIEKKWDDQKKEAVVLVNGDPYTIEVLMQSGRKFVLGYKTEADRNTKFRSLAKGLGVQP